MPVYNVAAQGLQFQSVKVADIPAEGPIAVPVPINFANGNPQILDISQQVQQGRISLVQSLFVDNSGNDDPVSIQIGYPTALQTIVCPSNSQGYFPILSPNPAKFQISSNSTGSILLVLLNSPVAGVVWSST